jgi:hypothetical protein
MTSGINGIGRSRNHAEMILEYSRTLRQFFTWLAGSLIYNHLQMMFQGTKRPFKGESPGTFDIVQGMSRVNLREFSQLFNDILQLVSRVLFRLEV